MCVVAAHSLQRGVAAERTPLPAAFAAALPRKGGGLRLGVR